MLAVVAKRVLTEHHSNYVNTTCYATFQVASGDRMELVVKGSVYRMVYEGDRSRLTFQGTRFLNFERSAENL